MNPGRKLLVAAIVILIILGAILASDPRFVSHSMLLGRPLLFAFLFAPTIVFAVIATIGWRSGRIWPAAAFAIGLLCTGLFHQFVAGETYGNPGYMAPMAHIAAPAVSLAAYLVSFLGGWLAVVAMQKIAAGKSKTSKNV